jgi:hypothetical protein
MWVLANLCATLRIKAAQVAYPRALLLSNTTVSVYCALHWVFRIFSTIFAVKLTRLTLTIELSSMESRLITVT